MVKSIISITLAVLAIWIFPIQAQQDENTLNPSDQQNNSSAQQDMKSIEHKKGGEGRSLHFCLH